MKRQREDPADEARHKYADIFNLLLEFAGPEDDFVLAFVAQGLAHLAFAPDPRDFLRPTLADIARTNRFFYRAYDAAHRSIVFPELDKRFAAFVDAYIAWNPTLTDRLVAPRYLFQPLQFRGSPRDSRPVVARLSVLHWLARHRYPAAMSPETRVNIDVALSSYDWISWFQAEIEKDANWNILGRPWYKHDMPTLACAAIAHSHRCVIGAVDALMWAYIDNSSRAKQREFITIWIFFGMTAGLANQHCILSGDWKGWTSDMVTEDKLCDRLIYNRSHYGTFAYWVTFEGTDE